MRWLDAMLAPVRDLFGAEPWGPFDLEAWRDLPHVAGRLGNETT